MTLILGTIALALVVALLLVGGFQRPHAPAPPSTQPERPSQPCPLCGSRLAATERVHSVVYQTQTTDKIMEISGCPHCRPPAALARRCPVCHQELRPQDVVTARVFERPRANGAAKTHVHVLGCPRCRSQA